MEYDAEAIQTVIELTDETVNAPIKAGDVLGTVRVVYDGETLDETQLLAIADVAKSELSSAASGTSAYIQKNWWKWVLIVILVIAVGVFIALWIMPRLQRKKRRRQQLEKRRQLLEERFRSYRDEL